MYQDNVLDIKLQYCFVQLRDIKLLFLLKWVMKIIKNRPMADESTKKNQPSTLVPSSKLNG